ncbi:MAG: SpoIIE family protein phosphatase [Anaerolineae bacterium]|nr:SpoIIE family protein phosphatase [Anaerolineae bacterium]
MFLHRWDFGNKDIAPNVLVAHLYALSIGSFGVLALMALTELDALLAHAPSLLFFIALSFILKRAGFHALPEMTHSLVGIVDLAAVLIFGPILGAWVAAVSGFFYLFLNALRREKHTFEYVIEMPLFNAGLKIGMAYASTHLYTALGGTFPPPQVTLNIVPALLGASFAWFAVDNIGWALMEFLRDGWSALQTFVRRTLVYAVLMELVPLPFAIVIAVTYTWHDSGLFVLIAAGLVGVAIIVQRLADASARLERRSNDLTALNEFARAVAQATFDADKVIDLLYEYARRLAPADVYRIELFDDARSAKPRTRLVLQATADATRHLDETQPDSLLYDYFATHREPIRAVDIARAFVYPLDAIAIVRALEKRFPTARSLLIVPLYAGDELLGTLALLSRRPRAFFPIQARNLTSICAQAAVTIQNARLYAIERKRAAQLATVSEVSRQVAALLDLDELLPRIVHLIRERFGYSHVHLFTVDNENRRAVFRASTHPRGEDWRARNVGYRIGLEGLVGWVAATGKPVLVNDVSKEPRFAPYPDKEVDETQSEIVVPLKIGDQVIGVLDVESDRRNAFTQEDLFILNTLAAQVAIAIEDARLYNLQKEEAYYLNALLQVAQNLSTTLDLDEVLETLVRITPLLVGVARCAIFLYDARERVFLPAKAYGLSRALQAEFQRLRFPVDNQFMFGKLLREQTPLVIEEAQRSELIEPKYMQQFGVHSLLVVPLITRGEVIGAMWVDQGSRPARFTTREIQVVMAIASQAAIAIEGVRLLREAEDKRRIEYELGLARQIQKSFLPEKCPTIPGYQVCAMWQTAREVSGDFYDFVLLNGGRVAFTIADVSDKGIAAAMFMALSRTILRTMTIGKPTPRETVERANDIILADARSDMFVTVFHGVLDPSAHRFTYVNAGHNPPLFYRAARNELITVKGRGMALGAMPGITLEEHTLDFEPGDLLLMYTDGVTDALNAQEEEFGEERLADLVATHAHLAPDALIAEIARAVTEFAGEGVHFDDVTMVALKRETKTQGEEEP